jgi:uncharacterized repeat protein (TIGR01451 family)
MVVQLSGPDAGQVGHLTEKFGIRVANTGQRPLGNIRVSVEFDKSLRDENASRGYELDGQQGLRWTLLVLPPGATSQYWVQFQCLAPAARACVRASARSDEGASAQAIKCLEIRSAGPTVPAAPPAPTGLTVSIAGLHDPIESGDELTYVIDVSNTGTKPETDLVLEVSLPPELSVVTLQTHGPEGLHPEIIDGKVVRFNPVRELAPGQSLYYRIRTLAKQVGEARVQAKLTAKGLAQPMVNTETTHITAPR